MNMTKYLHDTQLNQISIHPDFERLFRKDEELIEKMANVIKTNKYDINFPITLWECNDKLYLCDGHNRLEAAKRAGLSKIPSIVFKTEDKDWLIKYSIRANRDRRHLTDAQLYQLLEEVDERKDKICSLKQNRTETSSEVSGNSAQITAEKAKTSRTKVEKFRKIQTENNPEIIQAIKSGEISINKGYQIIKEQKAKETQSLIPEQTLTKNFNPVAFLQEGHQLAKAINDSLAKYDFSCYASDNIKNKVKEGLTIISKAIQSGADSFKVQFKREDDSNSNIKEKHPIALPTVLQDTFHKEFLKTELVISKNYLSKGNPIKNVYWGSSQKTQEMLTNPRKLQLEQLTNDGVEEAVFDLFREDRNLQPVYR
jgi:ParB family chromosome partitioning protein